MTEIEWADPPPTAIFNGSNQGRYVAFANALRQRQGVWAKLPRTPANKESATNAAANIRRGTTKGFEPKNAFETAVSDEIGDDGVAVVTVYVRYVGLEPRETGPQSAPADSAPAPHDQPGADNEDEERGPTGAQVRAWAHSRGITTRPGRLPDELWRMYEQAHAEGPAPTRPEGWDGA